MIKVGEENRPKGNEERETTSARVKFYHKICEIRYFTLISLSSQNKDIYICIYLTELMSFYNKSNLMKTGTYIDNYP